MDKPKKLTKAQIRAIYREREYLEAEMIQFLVDAEYCLQQAKLRAEMLKQKANYSDEDIDWLIVKANKNWIWN